MKLAFKKWVENIKAVAFNGLHTYGTYFSLDATHENQILYGLYSPCSLTKREEKKVRPQFFKSAIMILLVSVTKHHFTGNQHDAE